MSSSEDDKADLALEDLFALARDDTPLPASQLVSRVLLDAEAYLPPQAAAAPVRRKKRSLLARFWPQDWVSPMGWAAAGLGATMVTGFWIGVNPPAGLSDSVAPYLQGAGLVVPDSQFLDDPFAGFELDLEEV